MVKVVVSTVVCGADLIVSLLSHNLVVYLHRPVFNFLSLHVQIGGKEVECSPNFRLYLVSPDPVSAVPSRIASLVSTVVFQPELVGLRESILDSFLQLQNQKSFQDRVQLRTEIQCQSLKQEEVEKELLEALVKQEGGELEDPKAAKHILSLNKSYEDAMER